MTKVQGWDISLNHSGIVELTDGALSNFWFVSDKHTLEKNLKEHLWHLPLKQIKKDHGDWQLFSLYRLLVWENMLSSMLDLHHPDYVAIEDYALGKVRRSHYIGEIGAIARMVCFRKRIPLRLYDPFSVKMFSADHGHADKFMMGRAIKKKWGVDFRPYDPTSKANNTEVSEDLYDAYGIAKLLWTEVSLRKGEVLLNSLAEKQIRVFNRTTKLYPINILGRGWLVQGEEDEL